VDFGSGLGQTDRCAQSSTATTFLKAVPVEPQRRV
jgi:hypothetical protein